MPARAGLLIGDCHSVLKAYHPEVGLLSGFLRFLLQHSSSQRGGRIAMTIHS